MRPTEREMEGFEMVRDGDQGRRERVRVRGRERGREAGVGGWRETDSNIVKPVNTLKPYCRFSGYI